MTQQPERELDDRLADWVDGRMTDRERERFLAELRVNAQLRRDLADYEETVAAVRAALQAPTSPTNLTDRVLSAIAAPDRTPAHGMPPGHAPFVRRPLFWSLASAAAVLIVALLVDGLSGRPAVETAAVLDAKEAAERPDAGDQPASLRVLFGAPDADKNKAEASDNWAPEDPPGERSVADGRPQVREQLKVEPSRPEAANERAAAPPAATQDPATEAEPRIAGRLEVSTSGATPPAPAPGGMPEPVQVEELARDRVDIPDEAAGPGSGVAGPPASTRRRGEPGKDRAEEAEKKSATKPGAGLATGGAGSRTARPILPMVVLQGDPVDLGRDSGRDDASRAKAAAKLGASQDAAARLDAFFADQMRHDAPATPAPGLPFAPSLRFRPLEPPAAGPEAIPAQEAPAVRPTGGVAAIERTWLVEGTRDDVALVLRRLAAFAKKGNLMLATDETHAAPSDGDTAVAEPRAAGGAADQPKAAERRVVLRFRVLRR